MIQDAQIIKQILSGKRTMVRIPRHKDRCTYREGRVYVVKASQRAPVACHITVTSVREAMFEGRPVWELRFVKGDQTDEPRLLRASAPQAPICMAQIVYADGHKGKCGRAFADHQDRCKCGAKRPPVSEEDRGYTTRRALALKSAGEEIPDLIQKKYAREAEDGLRMARNALYGDYLARLQAVIGEIRAFAVDGRVNENLRGIERQAKSLERKLMKPEAA